MNTTDDTTTPERRVVKPAELRLLLYRLTLDWISLRESLPVPTGSSGRSSNVREYGHPAEWASDQCATIAGLFWWWHQELAQVRGETPPKSWAPARAHRPLRFTNYRRIFPPACTRTVERIQGEPYLHTPPTAKASREREIVVDAWKYLEPRIDQLIEITDPETEPFAQAFDIHGQIRARLGLSRGQWTLTVPCPVDECNLLTLQRIAGLDRDYIICGSCGYSIDAQYYPMLVRIMLDTLKERTE